MAIPCCKISCQYHFFFPACLPAVLELILITQYFDMLKVCQYVALLSTQTVIDPLEWLYPHLNAALPILASE